MKNFKLLLATTAILSLGALAVNASDGYNIQIHPKVTMLPTMSFTVAELNFGRISWQEGKYLTITPEMGMNNDTHQTYDTVNISGDAEYFDGAQAGSITMSSPLTLTSSGIIFEFPQEDVVLYTTLGQDSVECGRVSNFNQTMSGYISGSLLKFGGTFTISAYHNHDGFHNKSITCTGDATVTVVFPAQ